MLDSGSSQSNRGNGPPLDGLGGTLELELLSETNRSCPSAGEKCPESAWVSSRTELGKRKALLLLSEPGRDRRLAVSLIKLSRWSCHRSSCSWFRRYSVNNSERLLPRHQTSRGKSAIRTKAQITENSERRATTDLSSVCALSA